MAINNPNVNDLKIAKSYNDTIVDTITNDQLLNANIYDIHQYVENIKARYIDEDERTLSMGIFGYLGDINSNILQNTVALAAEYSNEAIPIKAKFEKNIISHALTLGVKDIFAQPATFNVILGFDEDELILNMISDEFILDREAKIFLGDYEFHVPFDVIIRRVPLPSGEYIYTSRYDITNSNPIIDNSNKLYSPYVEYTTKVNDNGRPYIYLTVQLKQYEFVKIYKKILTTNPLENKMLQFEFENQLAGFDIDVKEYGSPMRRLKGVYDGLNTEGEGEFFNYTFVDEKTIRIMFENSSYMPMANTDVTVNLYTCQGSKGNIQFNERSRFRLLSEKYNYDRLNLIVMPVMDEAKFGTDKKSIKELKQIIPKEALARGSVTNTTDINNYFNSIEDEHNKIYFFKKMDNPLTRLYYAFALMSTDTNIIPTNTIPIDVIRRDFDNISNSNYILECGNKITYEKGGYGKILYNATDSDIQNHIKNDFLYINPFTCIINKNPLYVSYYLNICDVKKNLEFTWLNDESKIQFISNRIRWYRHYMTDRNKYKLDITLLQNFSSDIGVIRKDDQYDPNRITGADLKIVAVFYSDEDAKVPYRWAEADFVDYNENDFSFDYRFILETNNAVDNEGKIRINNLYDMKTKTQSYGFMPQNCKVKIFTYVKNTLGYDAGVYNTAEMFPEHYLDGYSLTNIYTVRYGVDFLYNYSDILDSNIKIRKSDTGTISYLIDKVPVIGYEYINSEDRIQDFINELEIKRVHILDCLEVLEDTFGIDMKFFNTYGPSNLFYVADNIPLNKVNISLRFRVKLVNMTDKYLVDYIKNDIRLYIENMAEITDIHIPNIITYITQKYADNITYFEFLDFNGYGPGYQHIYRVDTSMVGKIPEFININSSNVKEGLDINIIIM